MQDHKDSDSLENVLKIYLENGQTKSFKFDENTIVKDVLSTLLEKLQISSHIYFALFIEYPKSIKTKKLKLINKDRKLVTVSFSKYSPHIFNICVISFQLNFTGSCRCCLRFCFIPNSLVDLAEQDLNAFNYFFVQSCNDVKFDRFSPEIPPDIVFQLAALYLRSCSLDMTKKVSNDIIDELGLVNILPNSILKNTKAKESKRIILHFYTSNASGYDCAIEKLNEKEVKMEYLELMSSLPSYGTMCFEVTYNTDCDDIILLNPRYGLNKLSFNNTEVSIQIIITYFFFS